MKKDLHIVTLNIPYPPDYGGIIDCFYRIRSLHNIGIRIHLHAFEYGRSQSQELEPFCSSVKYYPRDTTFIRQISLLPYSVISRRSELLLDTLLKDDHPILFDGIQTTLYLDHPALTERRKFVRIHNIENLYYSTLARFEKNPFRKLFYHIESIRLSSYESVLGKADKLITVSGIDSEHFKNRYHNAFLIPSFHPFDRIECSKGTGEYLLYHGDLSVNENAAVAEYLISRVFSNVPFRCIIAGKNPPKNIIKRILPFRNISLISNPDSKNMAALIRDAQINILPTKAVNGLKLKLLMSLFSGRHCLVNSTTIMGSGLDKLCHIADSGEEMIHKIHSLMDLPFSEEMISDRKRVLLKNNDNIANAKKLADLIFPG